VTTETVLLKKHTRASLFAELQEARAEIRALKDQPKTKVIRTEVDWLCLSNSLCERINQLNDDALGSYNCEEACDDAIMCLKVKHAMSNARRNGINIVQLEFYNVPEKGR